MSRNDILSKAVHECYIEMYKQAQPSADFDQLCKDYPDEPFYERYYLSAEEYHDIVNKYIDDYRINSGWKRHIELLEDYLKNGGSKDIWIPGEIDEDGDRLPGHRSYAKVPPLKEHIKEIVPDKYTEVCDKVYELIDLCKDFYSSEYYENSFRFTVMNASPNSNKEHVINYWKSKGIDLEIKEYNEEDEWN